MGQEIRESQFTDEDFAAFEERLLMETALLEHWFQDGVFSTSSPRGGFELEAWLVDRNGEPTGIIEPFLERLQNPLVVPELATFNVELNGTPQALRGDALTRMADELVRTWAHCNRVAATLDARLGMIGILPTVRPTHLTLTHMAPRQRYRALNEQIFHLRRGRPVSLDIRGRDHLYQEQQDVMLESAATSFQIHLKVNVQQAERVLNLSRILSAPMVAVTANSPFLFGYSLWDETRIPLFEQSVSVGASRLSERVTFGLHYTQHSVMECFRSNLSRFPVLLPQLLDEPMERLPHLRLHNGTIWRWNRPLIGFDDSGQPHLRIEHRVVPAGPTVVDAIANAALYFGCVQALGEDPTPVGQRLGFAEAQDNFYQAARQGLAAKIQWCNGKQASVADILTDELLPKARGGLTGLGIDAAETDRWLGIIENRVRTRQTGAVWQKAYVDRHQADMRELTQAYLERQQEGKPVHAWSL
jgi:hypothetical protein